MLESTRRETFGCIDSVVAPDSELVTTGLFNAGAAHNHVGPTESDLMTGDNSTVRDSVLCACNLDAKPAGSRARGLAA